VALTLGIESSCDDTAAAIVADGRVVLSSVASSQDDIHSLYGGIVPELASRRHIEMIAPVVEAALEKAGVSLSDIGGIGVTDGPGLVGSILVGLSFAKAIAYARKIPFVGVNHIKAHALAAFLEKKSAPREAPEFPFVALVVSGGHTTLMKVSGFDEFLVLGETRDDAAGEAFDKAAKLMGLGFPGGVAIDRLAKKGNPSAVRFTRPYLSTGNLDFSFSGLKTAVVSHIKSLGREPLDSELPDIAASFQEAVADVLVKKTLWALEATGISRAVVSGGVACNSRLREKLAEAESASGIKLFIPPPEFCSDNAAMVALSGHHQLEKGERAGLDLNAEPNWEG
jgi:N6-L-threonylcarbamoyladenine synthase